MVQVVAPVGLGAASFTIPSRKQRCLTFPLGIHMGHVGSHLARDVAPVIMCSSTCWHSCLCTHVCVPQSSHLHVYMHSYFSACLYTCTYIHIYTHTSSSPAPRLQNHLERTFRPLTSPAEHTFLSGWLRGPSLRSSTYPLSSGGGLGDRVATWLQMPGRA